jgi:hypothetical protein
LKSIVRKAARIAQPLTSQSLALEILADPSEGCWI